jgi:hypothetical protein
VEKSVLSVFYRKDVSIGYARARHKNKQGFYHHKQSKESLKLGELSKPDQGQYSLGKSIDPNLLNLSFNHKIVAGGEGFEPENRWRNSETVRAIPGGDVERFFAAIFPLFLWGGTCWSS